MGTYSKTVWQHFHEPKNVGRIEDPDLQGLAGSPRGGPFMLFTATLAGGVFQELKFQTYGCAPAIAAGSFLTSALCGKPLEEAKSWDAPRLLEALGGLPPDKVHCAELAILALKDLVKKSL